MVQFGTKRSRQKADFMRTLKRTSKNPVVLVLIGTPIFLLLLISFATHSIMHANADIIAKNEQGVERALSAKEARAKMFENTLIRTDLIYKAKLRRQFMSKGADAIWDHLIIEARFLRKETGQHLHAMEVGMHNGDECVKAAHDGMSAHCLEPSPVSNNHILSGFEAAEPSYKKGIHYYKMAAAAESDKMLPFMSGGFPEDHVGKLMDVHTMSWVEAEKHGKHWLASEIEPFLVKSVAIDDIIENKVKPTIDYGHGEKIDHMFVLKIETQGYEPEVVKGMKRSIEMQKIDFVIMEYWPKLIDFMHESPKNERCKKPAEMLKTFIDSGYTLYALHLKSGDNAPEKAKAYIRPDHGGVMNYNDLQKHCEFFYEVEEKFPSEDYHMGYFTDIVAVSPRARFPSNTDSMMAKLMKENAMKAKAEAYKIEKNPSSSWW